MMKDGINESMIVDEQGSIRNQQRNQTLNYINININTNTNIQIIVMEIRRERGNAGKLKLKMKDFNVLRYQNFDTVKICEIDRNYYEETDKFFIEDVKNIAKIRRNKVLNIFDDKKQQISEQDCDEIDHKARVHRFANIVNSTTKDKFENLDVDEQCQCGCKRGRGNKLPFCTDQQTLNVLGPGVLLMFLFKRTLFVILMMILLVYGIYSLTTNLLGSEAVIDEECAQSSYCKFQRQASDENKNSSKKLYLIQFWLGFVFSFIWIIALRFIKFLGKQKNALVDKRLRSASDYAVKIENLPHGNYCETELIDFFDGLWSQVEEKNNQSQKQMQKNFHEDNKSQNADRNCFNMKSIQIIYNMQFVREMIEQIFIIACSMENMLMQPSGLRHKKYIENIEQYKREKSRLKETYELLLDLRKRFFNDPEFRKKISTATCIIQFNNQKKKKQLLKYFGKEKVGLVKNLQMRMKKFFGGGGKDLTFKGKVLSIQRAPEPSDVQWTNCEKKFMFRRILVIYTATFLIVMMSFGILVGLQYLQSYAKKNNSEDEQILTILNILMSVALLIVNKVLWLALFYLLQIEYNHTLTEKIISQMNKVLFASSVNVIALPIIANYIINRNLYGSDGLSGMVFDYHIGVIGGLAIKIFDPLFLIKKVIIEIRCLRNFVIRLLCGNVHNVQPEKGVKVVNEFYEGSYFDVAENYVYIIGAVIHASFFCQLQPTIIIFVTAMVLLLYFINRFKILVYSKIPEMTDLLVFETAISQAGLVPIMYGTGSLVIAYMERSINKDIDMPYISSFISMGVGLIGILNPGDFLNKIVKKVMKSCQCLVVVPGENKNQSDNSDEDEEETEQDFFPTQPESKVERDDIMVENKQKTSRIQVYYENSNSLSLLGFERLLKGEEEKFLMKQLENFCQNFFPKNFDFHKEVGVNIINNFITEQQETKIKVKNTKEKEKEEMSNNESNIFASLYATKKSQKIIPQIRDQ